jgi:hypothetical protein
VNRSTVAPYRNHTAYGTHHEALRDQFERETVLPLGAGLIVIVLSSLGLWLAIWWVVSLFASGLLGVG